VEYALIRDVNDQPFRADLLGRLLAGRRAHVNLIPLNPTPGSKWDASPLPAQREFVARLRAHGVPTTVRDTRGSDIDGACGQLAAADLGVPAVASSLAETVSAAVGEDVVPLGAAPEETE
jgi:23S rRNA (adenine2503-C2)-methyltransferase